MLGPVLSLEFPAFAIGISRLLIQAASYVHFVPYYASSGVLPKGRVCALFAIWVEVSFQSSFNCAGQQ